MLSWLALWHLLLRVPSKTPATAPTHHQLQDVLAAEIQKWARQMPDYWKDQLEIKSDMIRLKGAVDTAIYFRVSRRDTPVALQGFHSPNLLFLVDEGSAIDQVIFETAQGSLSTPKAKMVICANPNNTSGFFYDCFHKNRDRWQTMTVGHSDSAMVDPEWVEQMRRDYGEESSVFRIRCLGEFSETSDDCVIGPDLVTSSFDRDIIADDDLMEVWGLDVARTGSDSTALVKRRGPVVFEAKVWRNKDLMQTSGMVLAEYEALPPSRRAKVEVNIDSIGLGAGVVDRLRETMDCPVRGINVAESPSAKGRFRRLRDELWWKSREWFEGRDVKCIDNSQLLAELTGPKYIYTSDGKLQVESKKDMAKRGIKSPDLADALNLTFASAAAQLSTGTRGYSSNWNKKMTQPKCNWVV
jgi:hypothetical protein